MITIVKFGEQSWFPGFNLEEELAILSLAANQKMLIEKGSSVTSKSMIPFCHFLVEHLSILAPFIFRPFYCKMNNASLHQA